MFTDGSYPTSPRQGSVAGVCSQGTRGRCPAALGFTEPVERTQSQDHTCLDHSPGSGTYIYGVQAINASGLASPITQSQPITVR